MECKIGVISGDGIGPEIVAEAKKVLDKIGTKYGHSFLYEAILMGGCSIDATGVPLTDEAIAAAKASDAVLMGSIGGNTATSPWYKLAPELRPEAGLLKLRMFRPFPAEEIAEALQGLKAVAILDKADSLNSAGGALFEDVTSAMYVNKKQVPMVNYIYGIGGRDTTTMQIESVYNDLQEIVKTGETGNPYRYLGLRKGEE